MQDSIQVGEVCETAGHSGPGLRTLFTRGGMGGAELAEKRKYGTGCADSTLLLCEQHDSLLLLVR